ncbi:hypothetical protein SDC9_67111 [bioreactor metagenome]|uniref:Uncharacterized protein n=1 Tax=bioreactor metagenome TaxID=1076179 RepID=A0A644XWW3_9ZZZZ
MFIRTYVIQMENADRLSVYKQGHTEILPGLRPCDVLTAQSRMVRINEMTASAADCPAIKRGKFHLSETGFPPHLYDLGGILQFIQQTKCASACRTYLFDILSADSAGLCNCPAALQLLPHLIEPIHLFRPLR